MSQPRSRGGVRNVSVTPPTKDDADKEHLSLSSNKKLNARSKSFQARSGGGDPRGSASNGHRSGAWSVGSSGANTPALSPLSASPPISPRRQRSARDWRDNNAQANGGSRGRSRGNYSRYSFKQDNSASPSVSPRAMPVSPRAGGKSSFLYDPVAPTRSRRRSFRSRDSQMDKPDVDDANTADMNGRVKPRGGKSGKRAKSADMGGASPVSSSPAPTRSPSINGQSSTRNIQPISIESPLSPASSAVQSAAHSSDPPQQVASSRHRPKGGSSSAPKGGGGGGDDDLEHDRDSNSVIEDDASSYASLSFDPPMSRRKPSRRFSSGSRRHSRQPSLDRYGHHPASRTTSYMDEEEREGSGTDETGGRVHVTGPRRMYSRGGGDPHLSTQTSPFSSGWVSMNEDMDTSYDPRALRLEVRRQYEELDHLRQENRLYKLELEQQRRHNSRNMQAWVGRIEALENDLDRQREIAERQSRSYSDFARGGGVAGFLDDEQKEQERLYVKSVQKIDEKARQRLSEVHTAQTFSTLLKEKCAEAMELLQAEMASASSRTPVKSGRKGHSRGSSIGGTSTTDWSVLDDAPLTSVDLERERHEERAKRRERRRRAAQDRMKHMGKKTLLHPGARSAVKSRMNKQRNKSFTLQANKLRKSKSAKLLTTVSKDDANHDRSKGRDRQPAVSRAKTHRSSTFFANGNGIDLDLTNMVEKNDSDEKAEDPQLKAERDRRREEQDAKHQEETRRLKEAKHIRREILSAEQKYAESLQILLTHYVRPIMKKQKELDVDGALLKKMFSNIEAIANFHTLLARDLEVEDAAQVFLKNAPFLRMYSEYVQAYDVALDALDQLKHNKKFKNFINNQRQHPDVGGMKLTDLLIMPVQRIPLYELLLTGLLEKTEPTDPSYSSLERALNITRNVGVEVNERKRYGENLAKLLQKDKKLAKVVRGLLKPTRVVVRFGEITKVKKNKRKGYLFILFNDALVWTSLTSYKFKDMLYLSDAEVTNVKNEPLQCMVFDSTKKGKEVILVFETSKKRSSWVETFEACIAQSASRKSGSAGGLRHSQTLPLGPHLAKSGTLKRSVTLSSVRPVDPLTHGMSSHMILMKPPQATSPQQKKLLDDAGIHLTPSASASGRSTPAGSGGAPNAAALSSDDDSDVPPPPSKTWSMEQLDQQQAVEATARILAGSNKGSR